MGAAEPRYVLQSPGLVENCVGLYVPLLEFNLIWNLLNRVAIPAFGCDNSWFDVIYADSTLSHGLRSLLSKLGGWSAVRPALCYDLCAREEADAVLAILVKVAES